MADQTPNDRGQNVVEGLKKTYEVMAKRHVHPWYSWGLMAAAIGFSVGVVYVANQNAQFSASKAQDNNKDVYELKCPDGKCKSTISRDGIADSKGFTVGKAGDGVVEDSTTPVGKVAENHKIDLSKLMIDAKKNCEDNLKKAPNNCKIFTKNCPKLNASPKCEATYYLGTACEDATCAVVANDALIGRGSSMIRCTSLGTGSASATCNVKGSTPVPPPTNNPAPPAASGPQPPNPASPGSGTGTPPPVGGGAAPGTGTTPEGCIVKGTIAHVDKDTGKITYSPACSLTGCTAPLTCQPVGDTCGCDKPKSGSATDAPPEAR